MGQRLLELGYGCPKERRIPLEGRLIDRYLVDLGHGCSLFPAHEQGQIALDALDDDSSPTSAPSGQVARQTSPATRTRPEGRHSVTTIPSAPARASTPVVGFRFFEPDPEGGFTELDRQPDRDRHDVARRQPEDRRDDGKR